MKVFNSCLSGKETQEVIIQLSKREAQRLVLLLDLAANAKAEHLAQLRRQAKPISAELNQSAFCFN